MIGGLGVSACGGASVPSSRTVPSDAHNARVAPPSSAPDSFAVGRLSETYVDTTRHTQRNGEAAEKPERTLQTLVLYPAKGTASQSTAPSGTPPVGGPWPLVIFSHGSPGRGVNYLAPLHTLASAGYVVVAPDYPLSKTDADGGSSEDDVPEQSLDIGFLIDELLAASRASSGPLAGLIDPARIGVAGHSLGAITSLGAGYSICCADRRIKAVAEWAGILYRLDGKAGIISFAKDRPLLIVHGDQDPVVSYHDGQAVYRQIGPPKYFVTLPGAGHGPPYFGGEAAPQSRVTTFATIDFLDRYLKGDRAGITRLHALVSAAGPSVATEQEQTR